MPKPSTAEDIASLEPSEQQFLDEVVMPRRKGAGGRLNRTETVTVRLDPKLNYLCELAARAQRRTKSSFIEWAIDKALEHVPVPGTAGFSNFDSTIAEAAGRLWDVDEVERLVALAENAPFLMTHEEQLIWKVITRSGFFWRGRYDDEGEWAYTIRPGGVSIKNLRDHWNLVKAVAEGAEPEWELPTVAKRKPSEVPAGPPSEGDLDSDVPF